MDSSLMAPLSLDYFIECLLTAAHAVQPSLLAIRRT
jgi:hypothetical protein